MFLEAIYHRPQLNWSYAYDKETIHLRLRSKRNDLTEVTVLAGDKYAWDKTKELIPMNKLIADELFDYWECTIKPLHRRLRYAFQLKSEADQIWMTEHGFTPQRPQTPNPLFEYPFLNPVDIFTTPEWVKDAVFYQIFPERFANGDITNDPPNVLPWGGTPARDNYFGGDLQGILLHLDYLQQLGVNALYLTPIFEANTNHKYDTTDYLKVDPHFGDIETLKKLVQACHERGIRILLDAVFNHAGSRFAPFLDVLEHGQSSKYKDWFHIHQWPITSLEESAYNYSYDMFAFEATMPKLNTEHPDVKKYLLNVAQFWVKEVGIDGWRLDVANEVDHQFWREFRNVVKQANPEAYILGEIWNDSTAWLQGDQFDAVMNYPFTEAVWDFIAKNKLDAEQFSHAMGKQLARYSKQASEITFNLLDSHDTPRLLTLCQDDKLKMRLAAVIQFTYLGVPCIYYGDEVGLTGEDDPDCRKCMEWDESKQDQQLLQFYKRLIEVRKQSPALKSGSVRFLIAEAGGDILAYERRLDDEVVVVVINNSDMKQTILLPVDHTEWQDVMNQKKHHNKSNCPSGSGLPITLGAYDYVILKSLN